MKQMMLSLIVHMDNLDIELDCLRLSSLVMIYVMRCLLKRMDRMMVDTMVEDMAVVVVDTMEDTKVDMTVDMWVEDTVVNI